MMPSLLFFLNQDVLYICFSSIIDNTWVVYLFKLLLLPSLLIVHRDIKDTTVGSLSQRITNQLMGLKGLHAHVNDINSYLQKVTSKQLPVNHQIIYQLQDVFNLLPDVNLQDFVKSVYVKTNDQMLVVYLASLIRSIIALHNLISNKIQNRDAEKNEGKDVVKEKKKETKEAEKKDGEKESDKKETAKTAKK